MVYRKFIDANIDPYRTPTPLRTTTDLLRPLTDTLTLLQTTKDPLTAFTDPIRPLPPAIYYTILYSMADISKQVSEGQKK